MMAKQLAALVLTICCIMVLFFLPFAVTFFSFYRSSQPITTLPIRAFSLFMKRDKTPQEYQFIKNTVRALRNSSVWWAKHTNIPYGEEISIVTTHLDKLLGSKEKVRYLIFFLNNRELRPGGGFIGSVGTITLHNYTLTDILIEDVYEIDGQLTEHVEPHSAVRKYLEQPNGFLRDSNFSPDFKKNVDAAVFFLQKTKRLQDRNFEGAVGITPTAFEYLLDGIGELYLTDYQTSITKDNFYDKTQTYVEDDFFPGSKQKRNFLTSLTGTMLLQLERTSPEKIFTSLYKGLAEKQIVLFAKTRQIESIFNKLGWAGRQSRSQFDYLFPVDANVGVNKINSFITRDIFLQTHIKPGGSINRSFTALYANKSTGRERFGGTYKNYFQLYMPRNITIQSVQIGNENILRYDTFYEQGYSVVGVFIEVPPRETRRLIVNYTSSEKYHHKRPYTLRLQKQIGSKNDNVTIFSILPDNRIYRKSDILNHDIMFTAL